jgi:subtilisin family serine protease
MLRVMLTCLALALPATGAMAAERVLLSPNGSQSLAASTSLSSLRAAAANQSLVPVIVGLKVPFAAEGLLSPAEASQQRAEIAAAAQAFKNRYAAAISREPGAFRSYDSLPFVAIDVTQAELEQLAADPEVISIGRNGENKPLLADSVELIEADVAHTNGFTGAGQTVVIIDTGVDGNHPMLGGGKVVAEACFSTTSSTLSLRSLCPKGAAQSFTKGSGRPCSTRVSASCDHGTHVAGIAAGASSTAPGVAPGANIIAIQAFSRVGSTNEIVARDSDLIAALNYVNTTLRSKYRIAAINLSLGQQEDITYAADGSCDGDADKTAFKTVIDDLFVDVAPGNPGIPTVVASGNDGRTDRLASPACITSAVSVGAVSVKPWGLCNLPTVPGSGLPTRETAKDKVACFSNTAASLDLLAPGAPITSSVMARKFASRNGTSMAAAHVTGAFAVLRSKSRNFAAGSALSALQGSNPAVATDDRSGTPLSYNLPPRIDVNAALDSITPSPAELAYDKLGNGPGSVSFSNITPAVNPVPAACTDDCQRDFANNTKVTLTATPLATPTSAGVFRGWGGGVCKGRRPTCTVTVAGLTQVTATFDPAPTFQLTVTRAGTAGTVETNTVTISNPIATPPLPPLVIGTGYPFVRGTRVTLTATANSSSTFVGWSGACKGKRTTCTVVMSRARDVIATFNVKSQTP